VKAAQVKSMKVEKKELKERTFIPYQITITVESENEHLALVNDFAGLEAATKSSYLSKLFRYRSDEFRAIRNLIHIVREHTK
jgi:hypothetical protein